MTLKKFSDEARERGIETLGGPKWTQQLDQTFCPNDCDLFCQAFNPLQSLCAVFENYPKGPVVENEGSPFGFDELGWN